MLSDVLMTVGLGLDVNGAFVIFWCSFAPKVVRGGSGDLMLEGPSVEEAGRVELYRRLSRSGFFTLFVGFIFQIGGVWA